MPYLTPDQKRKAMQANRASNTSIEIILRKALWKQGIRYRKNVRDVLGKPDICIKKYKLAVFCDGDFWHGRKFQRIEFKSNKKYWETKILRNIERDLQITIQLRDQGWTVLRFWESDIRNNLDECVSVIISHIRKNA